MRSMILFLASVFLAALTAPTALLYGGHGLRGSNLPSQEPIKGQRERLLILPSATSEELQPVADEAVSVVSDVAASLGRFDVVDRNDLEEILQEQTLQLTGLIDDSMVVEVGHIASAHEAVIVNVLNFHQQGLPPEEGDEDEEDADDEGFFGKLVLTVVKGIMESDSETSDEDEPFAHNIQTTLSVQVKQVNVETGTTLKSFTITADHTGGSRGYSRSRVMEEFRHRAVNEIKEFYILTSEVISATGREVLLFLGSTVGVRPGTAFEIIQPDRVAAFRNRDVVVPGRRVGLVEVRESSPEANRSIILRNWLPVESGYRALEYTRTPFGFEVHYVHSGNSYFNGLQAGVMNRPFHFTSAGAEFRLGSAIDTYGDSDVLFGLGAVGSRRFAGGSRVTAAGKLKLYVDLCLRPDDNDRTVATALFSAAPQLAIDFLLSESRDLTMALGYRLSTKSSHWTYSRQTGDGNPEQVDAFWRNDPPQVDLSGFFVSVGIKLYAF